MDEEYFEELLEKVLPNIQREVKNIRRLNAIEMLK